MVLPVFRNGNQANAAKRPLDAPAPTIMFGARSNKVEWMDPEIASDPAADGTRVSVEEAAILQSYPAHLPPVKDTRMKLEEIMALVPDGGNWNDLPPEILQEAMGGAYRSGGGKTGYFRRLNSQTPAPTIVGSPSQKSTLLWHPTENRPINEEEAAALQSYPSNLKEDNPVTDLIALDLFAGTGWGVACRWLGIAEYGVDNMPEVIQTREANGMETIYQDVWDGLISPSFLSAKALEVVAAYTLLIASPPCQTFSQAGAGAGRKALDQVLTAIAEGRYKDPDDLHKLGDETDPRTALVLTPLAYAWRDRPKFIVLEQVPPVLPVWEAMAEVLREIGYSVVTGNLQAEQYGVPQTRKRAILIARRDGVEAKMPTPTHSKYYNRDPKRLDEGVKPWVSMAEALGWGTTAKPSYTVTGGGRETGGYEAFPTGARAGMSQAIEDGEWDPKDVEFNGNVKFANGTVRDSGQPAPTITGGKDYQDKQWVARKDRPAFATGAGSSSTVQPARSTEDPAPTITGMATLDFHNRPGRAASHNDRAEDARRITPEEASALQSYPSGTVLRSNYGTNGDPEKRGERGGDQPAPTITSKADRNKWVEREPEDEWKWRDTPSTTVAGDPRITAREHHHHGEQNSTSFRLELPEAEVLQSYPPMVWKGTKGKVFLQIGNAVPPMLARAILSTLLTE